MPAAERLAPLRESDRAYSKSFFGGGRIDDPIFPGLILIRGLNKRSLEQKERMGVEVDHGSTGAHTARPVCGSGTTATSTP